MPKLSKRGCDYEVAGGPESSVKDDKPCDRFLDPLYASRVGWFLLRVLLTIPCVTPGFAVAASSVIAWGRTYGSAIPIDLTNAVAIDAHGWHNLALRSDGTVATWGDNQYGQMNLPANLGPIVRVTGGYNHSLVVRADGTVAAWGWNVCGQAEVPLNLRNVVDVAGGGCHSLGLRADGTVVAWGSNNYGQSTVPVNLGIVVAVAAGYEHSVALRADGTVFAWGANYSGQTAVPVNLSNVVAIAAGYYHSLALRSDGVVLAWGANADGQIQVPAGLTNVVAIAAGGHHSLALKANGTIIGWGWDLYGQASFSTNLSNVRAIAAGGHHSLALIGLPAESGPPRIIGPQVVLAAVERFFRERIVTATTADGYGASGLPPGLTVDTMTGLITGIPSAPGTYAVTLYATNATGVAERTLDFHLISPVPRLSGDFVYWNLGRGFNYQATINSEWVGAVGLPPGLMLDAQTGIISGIPLLQGDFLVSLTASNRYGPITGTLRIHITSPIVGWGVNGDSQTTIPSGLSNVVAIAAGGMALTTDGQVVGWDKNEDEDGDTLVPEWLSNVVAIAAGGDQSLALTADGQVVGWGQNSHGQTTVPSGLSNVVVIAAGYYHSLALMADGHVVGWGENYAGQTTIPSGLSNVLAIAAGWNHSLALTADGQVVGWGYNGSGQTTIPAGLSNVVAIAAGYGHSLALTADGHVVGWGDNYYGQTSIPDGLSNVVAIAAGSGHSLALTAEGRMVGWGYYGTNIPSGLSNVVAIAAGESGSLALIQLPGTAGLPRIISPRVALAAVDRSFHERIVTGTTADGYGASELPPGLTVDTKTGLITGIPSAPGTYSVTLYATNVTGVAERTVAFHVNIPVPYLLDGFVVWNQGRDFHYKATINAEWISASGLPPGLALDAQTGVISGVPLWQGDFLMSLTASNHYGSVTGMLMIRIASPIVGWGDDNRNHPSQTTIPIWLSNVVAIAAGGYPSLALMADGHVVSWGGNYWGQTNTSGLTNVVAIAAGLDHILALTAAGHVIGWGANNFGQATVPKGLSNVVAIAAGGWHSLALTANGSVVGWGANNFGATTTPNPLSNVVAITASSTYSLALTAEGRVVGWGRNFYDERTIPNGLSNVVAISACSSHNLALTADGQVVGWGNNSSGQTITPTGLSNVVAIAAGGSHSLALTADGQVVGWGENTFGNTNIPNGLSNVVAIAGGYDHSLALIGLPGELVPPRPVRKPGDPALTVQPVSRTVVDGDALQFAVIALGRGILHFQWQHDGIDLPDATNNILNLANVQAAQAGNFRVIVANDLGAITSRVARLQVLVRPKLDPLPESVFAAVGGMLTLSANATGTPPLRYQWRKNGANIPGATNATFTITNAQVSSGGSYSVVVANDVGAVISGELLLVVAVAQQPPGDNFADRFLITTNLLGGTNRWATREVGEPYHAGKFGSNSVWYRWVAPSNGIATFRTVGSTFDTLLGVYTGTNVSELTPVAEDEDRGGFFTSELRFNAQTNIEYAIAIDGFVGGQGTFILSWELEPTDQSLPVVTTAPSSQTVRAGSSVTLRVEVTGAGLTYQWHFNDVAIPGANGTTLMLRNVQPEDVGFYTVAITNSFGRGIESLPAAVEIGPFPGVRGQDKLEDLFSELRPPAAPGAPFAAASIITAFISPPMGTIGSQIFSTTRATTQAGELNHCGVIGGASLWFDFHAETNATVVIDTQGSTFDTVLAVYRKVTSLYLVQNQLDCNTDWRAGEGWSRVAFEAQRGSNYYIVVDGAKPTDLTGRAQLNWAMGRLPRIEVAPEYDQIHVGQTRRFWAGVTTAIPPPRYRWLYNGQPILGATNEWLDLPALGLTNAGSYSVVASNALGEVQQLIAQLTAPMLTSEVKPVGGSNSYKLTLARVEFPGQTMVLETSTILSTNQNDWVTVFTHTNALAPVSLEFPITPPQRFFRVRPGQ